MRGGPPYGGRNMGGGQGNKHLCLLFSSTIFLEFNIDCRAREIRVRT